MKTSQLVMNLVKALRSVSTALTSTPLLLGCIFLLSLILRFWSLLNTKVWLDETSVYVLAHGYSFYNLLVMNHWDVAHPPLFYLFTRVILHFNNLQYVPLWLIRLSLIIVASATIFPLFVVARSIIKTKAAIFPSLWFALHPFLIESSYSFRPYPILFFLFSLAWWLLLQTETPKKRLLLNLLFFILFFTDYASIWFFVAYFGYKFLTQRITKVIHYYWPFLIAILLWLPFFMGRLVDAFNLTSYQKLDISSLSFQILQIFGLHGLQVYLQLPPTNLILIVGMVAVGLIATVIGIHSNLKHFGLYALSFFLPILIALNVSFLISPIFIRENLVYVGLTQLLLLSSLLTLQRIGKLIGYVLTILFLFSLPHSSLYHKDINVALNPALLETSQVMAIYSLKGTDDAVYPVKFELLRQGFNLLPNTQDYWQKGPIKVHTTNIDIDQFLNTSVKPKEAHNQEVNTTPSTLEKIKDLTYQHFFNKINPPPAQVFQKELLEKHYYFMWNRYFFYSPEDIQKVLSVCPLEINFNESTHAGDDMLIVLQCQK